MSPRPALAPQRARPHTGPARYKRGTLANSAAGFHPFPGRGGSDGVPLRRRAGQQQVQCVAAHAGEAVGSAGAEEPLPRLAGMYARDEREEAIRILAKDHGGSSAADELQSADRQGSGGVGHKRGAPHDLLGTWADQKQRRVVSREVDGRRALSLAGGVEQTRQERVPRLAGTEHKGTVRSQEAPPGFAGADGRSRREAVPGELPEHRLHGGGRAAQLPSAEVGTLREPDA